MKPSKTALFDTAKRWDAAAVKTLLKASLVRGIARRERAAGAPTARRRSYAARLQRLKTLDLLIAAGADPAIQDDRGRDAIAIAKARRLPKDVIARLEKRTARA
jgi:hypothetical protein